MDPQRAESLLDAALAVKNTERQVIERLDGGATLSDAFNVVQHVEALGRGEQSVLRARGTESR